MLLRTVYVISLKYAPSHSNVITILFNIIACMGKSIIDLMTEIMKMKSDKMEE